jgi:hypothetical protein
MKKAMYILIAGFAFLFIASPGFSQEPAKTKDFKFTIKTNPLSALGGPFWVIVVPISGEYKILFETAVSKKVSLQVGASYIGPSVLINLNKIKFDTAHVSGISTNGFKFSGMLKFFLSRDLSAPKGFYVGPHISFASAKIASKDNSANYVNAQKLNINATIGYQLITTGGFTLDIFTGMGYVSRKWTFHGDSKGEFDLGGNRSGINVPLGLSFGYAF